MKSEIDDVLIWALLASMGGVARFLSMLLNSDSPPISVRRISFMLGANVFVSGFSGLMGALMMSIVTPDANWHFVSAGVFGFLGAKGLEIIADKISKKI